MRRSYAHPQTWTIECEHALLSSSEQKRIVSVNTSATLYGATID